jgi:hypothetical protein
MGVKRFITYFEVRTFQVFENEMLRKEYLELRWMK